MTSTRNLISVVLPTRNGARYLRQAVDSILSQTYPTWELIIVDDASTDATREIVAEYSARDTRVRAIINNVQKYLPGALNRGFDSAKGEYLTWTSDDNCYKPTAFGEMLAFLIDNPSVGLVYSDYSVIDEAGSVLESREVSEPGELLRSNCVQGCFLYRKATADLVGRYAEDLILAEDYDYWLRIWAIQAIAPLHRDLYLYRKHDESLTGRNKKFVIERIAEHSLFRNLHTLQAVPPAMKVDVYLRLAKKAVRRGDVLYGGRCLVEACCRFPAHSGLKAVAKAKAFLWGWR